MRYYKYEPLYPRNLWIANATKEDPLQALDKFTFIKNLPGWDSEDRNIDLHMPEDKKVSIATCYIVEERSTGELGILLMIYNIDNFDTASIAHESVHIADFYYEACGCNAEDYTEGNEAYAYLVGWAAGCIANVLIKEKNNDGKTKS